MASKDGGPAFPRAPSDRYGTGGQDGMTPRDYFAAAALQGMMATGPKTWFDPCDADTLATAAFDIADAMLAAREGGD